MVGVEVGRDEGTEDGCPDIDGVIDGTLLGASGWSQDSESNDSQLTGTNSGFVDPRIPSSMLAMNSQRALTGSIGGLIIVMFSLAVSLLDVRLDIFIASTSALPYLALATGGCTSRAAGITGVTSW